MRRKSGSVRALIALAAMVAGPVAVVVLTTSEAGAVTDDTSFRAAWLTDATVTLTQSFSLDCTKPTPTRNTSSPVTIEGNGFVIRQCTDPARGFMEQSGSGAVTVNRLHLVNSSDGLVVHGDLALNDASISNVVHGSGTGAAATALGNATLTRSEITGSQSTDTMYGLSATSSVTMIDSSIGDTFGADAIGVVTKGDIALANSFVYGTSGGAGNAMGLSTQAGSVTLVQQSFVAGTTAAGDATAINVPDGDAMLTKSLVSNTFGRTAVAIQGDHNPIAMVGSWIDGTISSEGIAYATTTQAEISLADSQIVRTNASGDVAAAIYSLSDVELADSQIADTTSDGSAAFGVHGEFSGATLVRSTIARTSGDVGSAAILAGNAVDLTNSTIADNDAFAIDAGDDVTLVYSDIVGNGFDVSVGVDAPALLGQVDTSGRISTFGTVFSSPQGAFVNCVADGVKTDGYNFADDTTCALTGTGDRQGDGLDPLLGALAANGGRTFVTIPPPAPEFVPETMFPASTSPLVNAIPAAACQTAPLATGITVDQLGLPRPGFTNCDIGSVELQGAASDAEPGAVVIAPKFTG